MQIFLFIIFIYFYAHKTVFMVHISGGFTEKGTSIRPIHVCCTALFNLTFKLHTCFYGNKDKLHVPL